MENPKPVGKDVVVAIAIKKGVISQAAVKWTIDNLLMEGYSVKLVHVIRPEAPVFGKKLHQHGSFQIDAFSGPDVRTGLEEGFKDIQKMRAEEMFLPFQSYCRRKNVQCETVLLQDNNIENALTDFVLVQNIDVLVMGAGRSGLLKKLKGPDVASRVTNKIPYFCTLYVVSKGKLQFIKQSCSISESVKEFDDHGHEDSFSPLMHSENPVNSRISFDRVQDFEFRSPLKDYGHSDFSIGGLLESESDISFISSDKTGSDGAPYSWLTNSSDLRSGSFASHASLLTTNSDRSNWLSGSSHSQVPEYRDMDELHKLQLELIKRKKEFASSCDEASNELILASKLNMLNQNEDQRMIAPQRSLSRAEGRRHVQATDLNQRLTKEESLTSHQEYRVYSMG